MTEDPDELVPDWVTIYFTRINDDSHRCSICEIEVPSTEKLKELLQHIKLNHYDIYKLHTVNPETQVGFRIEFLHLNVMKDGEEDPKTPPIILEEICETTREEIIDSERVKAEPVEGEICAVEKPKKHKTINVKKVIKSPKYDSRKRSWVWKYFHRISSIIFRCTLCDVVLSIKGCNTNNMNRHVRTRHPHVYQAEALKKHNTTESLEQDFTEVETPIAIKTEEICASEKDFDDPFETSSLQRSRRSWIWMYFNRTSATTAQCRLCNRNISHGGNATGNMNRHLKMIHQKTGEDHTWVWKVFENSEDDFYTCKICQFQCVKYNDIDKSVTDILQHLRLEHGVISGDQIITSTEECDETN